MQENLQKYSSAGTSLNQIPKVAKMLELGNETVLLDWGCGRYEKFKKYVEGKGAKYFGYDPYHKSMDENAEALKSKPDLIVCANVLNVIAEDWIVENIIQKIAEYNCIAYIQIYEGNKSGVGAETSKGYQRHTKASEYMPMLQKHFSSIEKKGNIFICENF